MSAFPKIPNMEGYSAFELFIVAFQKVEQLRCRIRTNVCFFLLRDTVFIDKLVDFFCGELKLTVVISRRWIQSRFNSMVVQIFDIR